MGFKSLSAGEIAKGAWIDMPNSILISGASSGIGRAISLELDRKGYQVFAGVRRSEDGQALRGQASHQLTPVLLDVTSQETIDSTCRMISEKTGGGLSCLVNNAGIDVSGALEFLPLQDFRQQLEVNLVGQLALTQGSLPLLRQAQGRILFISSIAGRLVTPFNGPYGASKAAQISLADALRQELSLWSVAVTVLVVGSVQTPIWEKSSRLAGEIARREPGEAWELYGKMQKRAAKFYQQTGRKGMPVEKLARIAVQAIEARHPRATIWVGRAAIAYELMARLVPTRWRDWILWRQMGLDKS
jgi:NAD(P)-dependent dehydrogenase (short-subunit alcohol dehydrogenase family)